MPGLVSAVTVEDPYESRRSSSLASAPAAEPTPVEPGIRGCLQAFQKKYNVLFELVKAWIIVGGYIVVGILMYIYALEEPWTVVDTMYFSVTTMSTVAPLVEKLAAARRPQPPPAPPRRPPTPRSRSWWCRARHPAAPPAPCSAPHCLGEGVAAQEQTATRSRGVAPPDFADVAALPAFPQVGYGDLYPTGPYSRASQRVPKSVLLCSLRMGRAWALAWGEACGGGASFLLPPPLFPSPPPASEPPQPSSSTLAAPTPAPVLPPPLVRAIG